jgi:N-acyl-D-amino-acid deacylase
VPFDLIIRNGYILNGDLSDAEPVTADIGIRNDRILAVGELADADADTVLDIHGLCASPGFIDTHAHSEFTLLADGRAEGKVSQGVTTEVNGNCGMSAAPLYGPALERRGDELRELDIRERWNSFDEYFRLLARRGMALNFSTLVGHNSLRASVAGYSDRTLSGEEKRKVTQLLLDAMKSGARGFSSGLIYPPGIFAETSEIIDLASTAASHGGIYTTHMRSEDDALLEAVDEVLAVASGAGIHAHISHLKTSGRQNWKKLGQVLQRIEEAKTAGLSVTCDRYPYTASGTDLDSLLPSWAVEGGQGEELKKIKEEKARLTRDILENYPDRSYWNTVRISSVSSERNKWMEGKSLSEIAARQRKTVVDTLLHILCEEELRVSAIFFTMSEENLQSILRLPYSMIGSDSASRSFDGVTAIGIPHPRGFGSFPKVLGNFVREENVLSLGEAIYKMTKLPARVFGLEGRGAIEEGCYADIVIFDPDAVNDTADYDNPFRKPEGIHHVFVNGTAVVLDGSPTGALPGRILT